MQQSLSNAVGQLLDRAGGPLHLRLVLQPIVASIIAIRAGLTDARERRPAFLWTLVSKRPHRRALLGSGWKDVGKVFVIAFVLDGVYQVWVLHWFYPLQALIVGFVLAIIPYVVFRGPTSRIASRRSTRANAE